jgi:hypothetical protein
MSLTASLQILMCESERRRRPFCYMVTTAEVPAATDYIYVTLYGTAGTASRLLTFYAKSR